MFSEAKETVFIGDIHGQAPTLLALLEQLGWRERDRHLAGPPGRKLLFLGDLVDNGRQNLRTVEIVRELVERSDAICLMGNHEYNAIQFQTPDPENPDVHLRRQDRKNREQHERVLEEIERRPSDWSDMLGWFRTLPLAIDAGAWRAVHACWHPPSLAQLERRGTGWHLPENRWTAAARPDEPEYCAVEMLLKGPEHKLPGDHSFLDNKGHKRTAARVRWWHPAPRTWGEALEFPRPPKGLDLNEPWVHGESEGYPENAPPVFFGHYWRTGEIEPERPNAACLDYSAGRGERLVAYRWRGENRMAVGSFVSQEVVEHGRPEP